MKAVNQLLAGVHIATMAEALTFGMTQGVYTHAGMLRMLGDKERANVGPTREVRTPSAGRSPQLPLWEPVRE